MAPFEGHNEQVHTGISELAWISTSRVSKLTSGEVHVWRADLDRSRHVLGRFADLLAEDEMARSMRFRVEDDRLRYILARGLLRYLLGAYLEVKPEHLRFRAGQQGKPALAAPEGRIAFNVSHALNHILIAVACNREVGVDVEPIRSQPDNDALAARFFSPQEFVALTALSGEDRIQAFYTCWTRKEAYLKASCVGLLAALNTFTVPLAQLTRPYLIEDGSPQRAPQWALHDLAPIIGYATALVVACNPRTGPHTSQVLCRYFEL